MRPLSMKLRGCIGIKKGLGRDEVEININDFPKGIIVLSGDNGKGKSTIMGNLHPYLKIAGKKKGLAEYFYLKDSLKILIWEHEGKTYTSKFLIDGFTKKMEAYLYENDMPYKDFYGESDGKITLYRRQIEALIGSEKLFFNSVYSAKRLKGISELQYADRRKIFYELLDLNRYEARQSRAKFKLETKISELTGAEGEVRVLRQQIEGLAETKQKLSDMIEERELTKASLEKAKEELLLKQKQTEDIKNKLAVLNEQRQHNEALLIEKKNKESEISRITADYNARKYELEKERDEKLKIFEESNIFDGQISELKTTHEQKQKSLTEEKAQLELSIENLKTETEESKLEIDKLNAKINRLTTILNNKEKIKDALKAKEEATKQLGETMLSDQGLTSEMMELQQKYNDGTASIAALERKKEKIEESVSQINKAVSEYEYKIEIIEREKEELRIKMDSKKTAMGGVPCDTEMGSVCPLLRLALGEEKDMPVILQNKEAEIEKLKIEIESAKNDAAAKLIEKQNIMDEIETLDLQNESNFGSKIEVKKIESGNLKQKVKELTGKLAEINKNDWKKLSDELSEADKVIAISTNKIESLEKSVTEKTQLIEQYKNKKINTQTQLSDNLQIFNNQTNNILQLKENEKKNIATGYIERIKSLSDNHIEKTNYFNKEIEAIKIKIDTELEIKISGYENLLQNETVAVNEFQLTISKYETEIIKLNEQISEINSNLTLKKVSEDKIAAKEAEIQYLQREIRDYEFLVEAFGKTGIPVLKLENSAYEITSIANDLLMLFNSRFRVSIKTVEWTKDNKKLKEIFDILVLDDDDADDISEKSDGEQVIIESAIQLATAQLIRERGKKIQASYLDERDGALSAKKAMIFTNIMQKAHEMGHVHHTFFITHRTELLDYLQNQIKLTDEGVKIVIDGEER